MKKQAYAIIVAGGKGQRMNTDVPKQFIEIQGKPILMYTLEVFARLNVALQIILVLPETQVDFWKELCLKHRFTVDHKIAFGGKTRFESVKNGLSMIQVPAIVAIHDGVRPFVSIDTIFRCFEAAENYGAAIPVIELVDSVRQVENDHNFSVDRTKYKLVQTPQVFDADLIHKAYQQEPSPLFTDDASVVEALGHKIHLVEGNRENIKITTAFDLKMAEGIL